MPVPQTLLEEYRELVEAEHNAEGLALDIGRALRDNVHIDRNGNLTGRPSSADFRREAEAWARVASLRAGRYLWIETHS